MTSEEDCDYATYSTIKEFALPEPKVPESGLTGSEETVTSETVRKSPASRVVPPKVRAKEAKVRSTTPKPKRIAAPGSRRWVPPTFITVGLLGVAWLITYYVAGQYIPFMTELGNWNILIGMGGMAAAFGIATLWK